MLSLALVLLSSPPSWSAPPPPQSFDFRSFETTILQPYLARFVAGSGVGAYGATPSPVAASPFGSRAALKALYVTQQLNVSDDDRDAW